jgi:Protein of unknown function (DUF1236)
MRKPLLHAAAATLLFFGAVGFAAAQNPSESSTKPKEPAEQNPSAQHTQQPDANNPTASQVAPGEPKSVTLPETGPALVNGALATPNAPKDAQTVPAKFSAKNDAEDHLPIVAFAFKNLSDEQKRTVVASVKDAKTAPLKGTAPPEAYAKPSMQLPSSADLRALPDVVTAQMPELKPYRYNTVGDKVLLVDPKTYAVVAVLGE